MTDKIHVFLSNILWAFKCVFFRNKEIFKAAKPYLVVGSFRNSRYCDYIYETSQKNRFENVTFASTAYQSFFAKILIMLVTRFIKYKNFEEGSFKGKEIIISSSHQEYKIFNVEQTKVLTLFSDREKLSRVIANKKHFENSFNVAKTLEVDYKASYCIEEFVKHESFDKETAFQVLANQYAGYVRKVSCCKDYEIEDRCRFFSKRFGQSDLLCRIRDFPMVFTHGDLWKSNVIYDGFHYYITDFEAAKPRFVLYDLFCFMFTEYIIYNDITMIQRYFWGKYDEIFSQILRSVNVRFDDRERGVYLLAYLVAVLNERWRKFFKLDYKITDIIKKYIPNYR